MISHDFNPARRIAMMTDRIYRLGMTTASGGNISVLDDNGDIWITPAGVDKGTLSEGDIVKVKSGGGAEGIHRPSSELYFHSGIYRRRKDIRAVIHAHPPSLIAFAIAHKIPNAALIPDGRLLCGEVRSVIYRLPGSAELGKIVADGFEENINAVIMENHGVVVGAPDLSTAFARLETLNSLALIELNGRRIGRLTTLSGEDISISADAWEASLGGFDLPPYGREQDVVRAGMCAVMRRACRQRLFTCGLGTVSHRLSDGSFLITPRFRDGEELMPEDIMWIRGRERERGSDPDGFALFHREIYEKQPHISSVITARPPNIMAFAVTDAEFDSKTIPESYVLLGNVPKLPFGSRSADSVESAGIFETASAAIIQNDCAVVTGTSLSNTFDRLEVLEYSAKSLILCRAVGDVFKISGSDITEIEKAFKL